MTASCVRWRTVASGSASVSIDMLFVHDIGTMNHARRAERDLLEATGGRWLSRPQRAADPRVPIKAIGLGVNEWQVLVDALALGDWDAFLLAQRYTLLEQEALSPLMDACLEARHQHHRGRRLQRRPAGGRRAAGTTGRRRRQSLRTATRSWPFAGSTACRLPPRRCQMPLAHPAVCCVLAGGTSAGAKSAKFIELVAHRYCWRFLARPRPFRDLLRVGTPRFTGEMCTAA